MAKSVKDVRQCVTQLTIFDAILHCKNAWGAISPETIVKCFKHSSVHDFDDSPPCSPTESMFSQIQDQDDAEFDPYWVDYVEEPIKYQPLRPHFFSMGGVGMVR